MDPIQLTEQYQILQMLGKGVSGQVYKAKHKLTGHQVAIKKILMMSTENQQDSYVKAIKKQIQIMRPLKNPNTLKFIDFIQAKQAFYIITELCNYNLTEKIKKDKVTESDRQKYAIELLTQITNGLNCLDREKILHRDLKPQNILDKNGLLKICDFGNSKRYFKKQQTFHTFAGTIDYESPQMMENRNYPQKIKYKTKSDIWSLGVIFYRILFQQRPWKIQNDKDYKNLLQRIKKNPIQKKLQKKLEEGKIVGKKVHNFLIGCLQYQQKNRMNWQQLFQHDIFKGFFDKTGQPSIHQTRLVQYIQNAKQYIKSHQLNIQKILSTHFSNQQKSQMNFESYYSFLQQINPNITLELGLYIFNQTDTDISDTVEKHQILKFFSKHGIEINPSFEQKREIPQQIIKFLTSLSQLFQNYPDKYNLQKVFKTFDNDRNGKMDLKQFINFIMIFDSKLGEAQIKKVFQYIDQDNSKKIQFKEFLDLYQQFEQPIKSQNQ